jgi:hypothetical protein
LRQCERTRLCPAEASTGGVKLGSVSDGRLGSKIKITTDRAIENWEGEVIVFESITEGYENNNQEDDPIE